MRHITYCLQFKGSATPGSDQGILKATTSATSASIKTVIGPDGVEGCFIPAEGGMAYFESEVKSTGPHHFTESGSITFGEDNHVLNFSTVGQGEMTPSADPKEMTGVVSWRIDSGEGQFQGATGFITSNFMVSATGEVTDYQFGLIFLK